MEVSSSALPRPRLEALSSIIERWSVRVGARGLAMLVDSRTLLTERRRDATFLMIADEPRRFAFEDTWLLELGQLGLGRLISVHGSRQHAEARFAHTAMIDVVLRVQALPSVGNLRVGGTLEPISDPDGLLARLADGATRERAAA